MRTEQCGRLNPPFCAACWFPGSGTYFEQLLFIFSKDMDHEEEQVVVVYSVSGTRVGRRRGQVRQEVTLLSTSHSRIDPPSLLDWQIPHSPHLNSEGCVISEGLPWPSSTPESSALLRQGLGWSCLSLQRASWVPGSGWDTGSGTGSWLTSGNWLSGS